MSILVTKKTSKIYLIISIVILIFSIIYEYYSHGVYSVFMITASLVPFLLGTVVFLYIKNKEVNRVSLNAYHSLIATITMYFICHGFLDIYGTTNKLLNLYLLFSILLILIIIIYRKKK